jgi:hypothetical protein
LAENNPITFRRRKHYNNVLCGGSLHFQPGLSQNRDG